MIFYKILIIAINFKIVFQNINDITNHLSSSTYKNKFGKKLFNN